jgi:hypothetical protein
VREGSDVFQLLGDALSLCRNIVGVTGVLAAAEF